MNQVSIYEISCYDVNRQLIQSQDENKKRLARFIEKHLQKINEECDRFFTKSIMKLSTPMTSIDDFSAQRDNLAEIASSINDIN